MQKFTILCTFDSNAGWRIHRVTNIESDSISIVVRNGIKMLAIPVVRKLRPGHFCNPVKLVMQVMQNLNRPIRLAQPHSELLQQEQTFARDWMRRKIEQTCVSIQL